MSYRRVLSCSPVVWFGRSARPLLAELCRGVVSTTTPSDIVAFSFSATAMFESSLSQRILNLPTKNVFTKSATELARSSVAPFVSDAIARMQPVLESTSVRHVPRSSSAPPSSARAFLAAKSNADDGLLVTFQRCKSDVRCFDATSQQASFTPQ